MEPSPTTAVTGAAVLGVIFVVVSKLVEWVSTMAEEMWTKLLGG